LLSFAWARGALCAEGSLVYWLRRHLCPGRCRSGIVIGRTIVRVKTLFKGEIDIADDQVITFVEPLIGFEDYRRFVILQTTTGPLYWLQSVDDETRAFCLLAPFQAGLDPDLAIGTVDAAEIGAEGVADIDVYTLVVLDEDRERIRTNLRAPILVCQTTNQAKQILIDNPDLPIQFLLKDLPATDGGGGGAPC
jgi:flagellar assembly factor FliW